MTDRPCTDPGHMMATWVGVCCREWIMSQVAGRGRCGLCGTAPVYVRPGPDIHIPHPRDERKS